MRAYHFLSAKYAIDDIQRQRLKISRFGDLNDPFELLSIELTDKNLRQAFIKNKEKVDSVRGVLCFSRSWHNPVIWSHYADKHKGICLGFDISDSSVFEVTYDSDRLIQEVRGASNIKDFDDEFMRRLLATKYMDWRYEDEIRVITTLGTKDKETGYYFKNFSNTLMLKEVIFGSRLKPTQRQVDVIKSSIDSTVKMTQAQPDFQYYKIVENIQDTKELRAK